MSYQSETRSILDHIEILGQQLGYENATQLAAPHEVTQASPYERVNYDPVAHDPIGAKQQIVDLAMNRTGCSREEVLMWLDAARLCSLTARQGIDLRDAHDDPKVDAQVQRLVAVLQHQVFDSAVFQTRWRQPIFRPWLYLVAYFIEVTVIQQWQRDETLFIIGVLVTGPVIPEWFVRVTDPLPVAIRAADTGEPIPVKRAVCVYLRAGLRDSFAETLLTWAFLTSCSADRALYYVLFPLGGSDAEDVPMTEARYVGWDPSLWVVSREFPEQRFFPTQRLLEMMEAHERPGFRVEPEHGGDYDRQGRPVVRSAPGPQSKQRGRTVPEPLSPVPRSIHWP